MFHFSFNTDSVQLMLRNGGFFDKISQDCIYLTVHDAVTALTNNANVSVSLATKHVSLHDPENQTKIRM